MTNEYNLIDDEQDISDLDFSEIDINSDLNWFSKLNPVISEKIMSEGSFLGRFDESSETWWSVIKYKSEYFISFSDFNDVFEVNDTILKRL